MPSERARLAIVMTLMMVLSPISYAGVSNWSGPSVINSEGSPTVVDGFTVPTNSTIMDGWVHVTNSQLSSSSDSGITWDEDDFSSGNLVGVELNDEGEMVLKDDGTRSNISTSDVGEISVLSGMAQSLHQVIIFKLVRLWRFSRRLYRTRSRQQFRSVSGWR